jgi:long-chain acyl-CoA synthetase
VVAEVNRKLTEHERLRRWKLLERELTIEAGELTPTLKIRRKAIAQRYADEIASLYPKSQKRDG